MKDSKVLIRVEVLNGKPLGQFKTNDTSRGDLAFALAHLKIIERLLLEKIEELEGKTEL